MGTSTRRVAAAAALSLPLTAGLLLGTAPAAGAAIAEPGNGTVYAAHAGITIRADYERSSSEHRLTLTSPGGPAVTVATAPAGLNGGTMTYRLDTGCWTFPSSSCTGRRPAPNGTWTVTQSGGSSGTSTFVTRIAPAAPTGVAASAVGTRQVKVTWRLGDEPDLTGYAVLEGANVVSEVARSACDGTSCSAVVSYANEGTGDHTYTVRASRAIAPGSSATLESAPSAPVTARLESPPPPPANEAQSGSGSGSTGGSSGSGSTTGGGTTGSTGTGGGSGTGSSSGTGSTGSSSGSTGSSSGSSGSSTAPKPTGEPGSSAAPITTGSTSAQEAADQQAVAQRKAFALTFSAFGPKLGIPKLPPLPQAQAPAIAPELADGTYDPQLPGFEQDKIVREQVEVAAPSPTERVTSVVSTAFDRDRLLRSTAAALVLLLAGAHLRRWLGSAKED